MEITIQSNTTDPSTAPTVQQNASVMVFCGCENFKIRVFTVELGTYLPNVDVYHQITRYNIS
jgi:hypothetical protein